MTLLVIVPLCVFAVLVALERACERRFHRRDYARSDRVLNAAGIAVQGALVPAAGYFVAQLLASRFPDASGSLHAGGWGAFLLNFVAVDFLYYWQHRLFHAKRALWALHQCHHASPKLSVWATSRNSLAINALFVYLLVNPVLGFLCDRPDAFFAGAAVTASLDLWRHSRLPESWTPQWLGRVLVTPAHHHLHHSGDGERSNYGANLIWWDRLFGTAKEPRGYPSAYGTHGAPGPWRQFLFPW